LQTTSAKTYLTRLRAWVKAHPVAVTVAGSTIVALALVVGLWGKRDDFASGTSSKSSKLVHGGLRYLQQREFRLVGLALLRRLRLLQPGLDLRDAVRHHFEVREQ